MLMCVGPVFAHGLGLGTGCCGIISICCRGIRWANLGLSRVVSVMWRVGAARTSASGSSL